MISFFKFYRLVRYQILTYVCLFGLVANTKAEDINPQNLPVLPKQQKVIEQNSSSASSRLENQNQTINPKPLTVQKSQVEVGTVPVNIGRLSDTLIALFPGSIIHGAGHWYRGDYHSARKMMYLEGISLLSLLTAYTLKNVTNQSNPINKRSTRWFYHLGSVLFVTTWLTDLIGSFRGDQINQRYQFSDTLTRFSAGYRYQDDPQKNLNHHVLAQFDFNLKSWQGLLAIDWESGGRLLGLSTELVDWVYEYDHPDAFHISGIRLGTQVRRWAWLYEDLTQWLILPFIEGELGLDLLSAGLKSFAFYHRIALGWERFDLAPVIGSDQTNEILTAYPLVLDSGLIIRPSSDVLLTLSIKQDRTQDLRPINENHLFWGGELILKQSDQVDLNTKFLWGEDWSMWITVAFKLGKRY